jgi:hypothetical protein
VEEIRNEIFSSETSAVGLVQVRLSRGWKYRCKRAVKKARKYEKSRERRIWYICKRAKIYRRILQNSWKRGIDWIKECIRISIQTILIIPILSKRCCRRHVVYSDPRHFPLEARAAIKFQHVFEDCLISLKRNRKISLVYSTTKV